MKTSILAGLTLACICCSADVAIAAKNTAIAPTTDRFEKRVLEDSFDGTQLDSNWNINKGSWKVQGGQLVGGELPADQHAAVLTLKQPSRDSAIRFSFRLDGAQGFNLSLNHARGHLFRVMVQPGALVLRKDRNKRDPDSRVEQLARSPGNFKPGEWYTLLLEIDGDRVTASTDQGAVVTASDADLNVDKTGYRFVVRGNSVALDDVQVWHAND